MDEACEEMDPVKNRTACTDTIIALKNSLRETYKTDAPEAGLAAPQIGKLERIFVVNFKAGETNDFKSFINPMIISVKGTAMSREKCVNLGKQYIVVRYHNVAISYMTPMGKIETAKFTGSAARVIQYLTDHLNGISLKDIGLEIDDDFDLLSDEDKQSIITQYLEGLDIKVKAAQESLKDDEFYKQAIEGLEEESTKTAELMAMDIKSK